MKCRLCVNECQTENEVQLFKNDEDSNLTKLIAKYLYIEITQLDTFSTVTCKGCIQHLNDFHQFFQYVEQQQQVLQKEFLEVKCVVEKTPLITITEVENVQTFMEDNDESLLDIKDVIDVGETCFDKSKSTDEFGFANNHSDELVNDKAESEEDAPLQALLGKIKDPMKSKSSSVAVKARKSKKKTGKRKYKKKLGIKEGNDQMAAGNDDCSMLQKLKKEKRTAKVEDDKYRDEIISKHIQLKCEICDESFQDFNDLRKHFRIAHKTQAYIICCGARYLRKYLLCEHIKSHINPDRFKCEYCEKVLKSGANLKLHMANMHVGRNKMTHECYICGKKFPYLSGLNNHMVVHNDELSCTCKICSKGFKTDQTLKLHIRHVHTERSLFICETCGKEYRLKQSFERHMLIHEGRPNEPTEQCEICGKWLRYNCMRRHMQRHENRTFECEICHRICKTKSSLKSHIDYSHKMKQIHSCTVCGKSFKKAMLLREHMAMHTGQKDYNCPHCPREFRSKANMYVHVKKIHVEEWTKAQIARNQGPTEHKEKKSEV